MSSRTIFFKNCPTERKRGEKIVLLKVIAAKEIVLVNVIATKKNRLQRGGVWRLYELLFGTKKNCPVKSQIVQYIFKLSCKNFSEKS